MAISLVAIFVLLVVVVRVLWWDAGEARILVCTPLFCTALLELCDLCAVSSFAAAIDWKRCSLMLESLLPAAWLVCSFTCGRDHSRRGISWTARVMIGLSTLLVVVPIMVRPDRLFYAPDFPGERLIFLLPPGYYFYLTILALLVAALINFETTLTNAFSDRLWRLKLKIVGLSAILAVQIYYFCDALLYRTLDMELVPLRCVVSLLGAAMIYYADTKWSVPARVQVSQTIMLRSLVLFTVAGYLVMVGLAGEGMSYFGALFPRVLSLSLVFLLGILLILLLLSQRLQRKLKVFLHKHFLQSKYDYRTQWLALSERLSTFDSGDELLRRVLNAFCELFGAKGGALFLCTDGDGWFCAMAIQELEGALAETFPQENSLVGYLGEKGLVFYSGDHNPEVLAENRSFFERYRVSFVVPLCYGERLTGFIVLGEQLIVDEQYRYEDFDLMKTIARQASVAIQHQLVSERLMQAKAMEAMGSLATFVAHDLKNLAATFSLILENAADHLDNPEFQKDMLSALRGTAVKMQGLVGRLKNFDESELYHLYPVDLLALVERSALMMQSEAVIVQGTRETALADEEKISKVVLNLLLNGIEASGPGSEVVVAVGFAGAPFIKVTDRGCGMSPRFLKTKLFAPFCSTKPNGLGIGLYQCRQIVTAHGGRIEVSSVEGEGTSFTVWFPPAGDAATGEIAWPARLQEAP